MEVVCLTNKKREENTKYSKISVKDAAISGICAYLCAICTLPSSGIATTLPAAFVLSVLGSVFCKTKWMIYAFFTAMPLLLNCLYGFPFSRAVSIAAISLVSAFFGVLTKRAVQTVVYARKKRNDSVVIKGGIVLVLSFAVSVALWLAFSGNPVSAMIQSAKNKDYISEKYADAVQTSYTYFDLEKRLYLTKVTFEAQPVGEEYYVSYPCVDEYENYCLELVSADAKKYFKGQTTLDTERVKCYLDTSDIAISPDENYKDHLSEFEYLVEISDEITGLKGFRSTYGHLSDYIYLSDTFEYKSVTFSGKDANGNSYFAHIKKGEMPRYVFADEKFEQEINQKFYR